MRSGASVRRPCPLSGWRRKVLWSIAYVDRREPLRAQLAARGKSAVDNSGREVAELRRIEAFQRSLSREGIWACRCQRSASAQLGRARARKQSLQMPRFRTGVWHPPEFGRRPRAGPQPATGFPPPPSPEAYRSAWWPADHHGCLARFRLPVVNTSSALCAVSAADPANCPASPRSTASVVMRSCCGTAVNSPLARRSGMSWRSTVPDLAFSIAM